MDGSKERRPDSEAKVSWLLILTLQKGKIYQVRQGFSKNDKRLRKVLKVSWISGPRRVLGWKASTTRKPICRYITNDNSWLHIVKVNSWKT